MNIYIIRYGLPDWHRLRYVSLFTFCSDKLSPYLKHVVHGQQRSRNKQFLVIPKTIPVPFEYIWDTKIHVKHDHLSKKKLNPLYSNSKMLCAKFSWNWPRCSGEVCFKNCQCIFDMLLLSPLEKRRGISLKQPFPCKRMLCVPSSYWKKLSMNFLYLLLSPIGKRKCPFI